MVRNKPEQGTVRMRSQGADFSLTKIYFMDEEGRWLSWI